MISLTSLIPEGAVLLRPEAGDKNSLIRALVDALIPSGELIDANALFKDVLAREALAPTGLGLGCAIPHAHSSAMRSTRLALAILDEGIDFDAPDGQKARVVVLLVGPPNNPSLHLKLLSKIARLLHDAQLREDLVRAQTPEEVLSLLAKKETS